jgi:hypothetical protein
MTELWTIEENLEKLKPTGMAGGVQPNGSSSRMDKVNGPALRRPPTASPAISPAAHTLSGSGSEWAKARAQQRQAADRSRFEPPLEQAAL